MTELTAKFFCENGYLMARQLPDGRWIGLQDFIYTVGICVDLNEFGYEHRYCYERENLTQAFTDFLSWSGDGDPAGLWMKRKPGDIMNPRWVQQAKQQLTNRSLNDGDSEESQEEKTS